MANPARALRVSQWLALDADRFAIVLFTLFYGCHESTRIILRGIDYRVKSKNVEVTSKPRAARPGQAGRGRRPSCIHGAWLHRTRVRGPCAKKPLYYRCITISNYYLNLSALCLTVY